MELHRASFAHEVGVFRVHSDYAAKYPTGAPVRAVWGAFPNARDTFFGYVHHDEPRADKGDQARRPETDIVCVGATGVLGEDDSRSWLNTRFDLMVQEIAEANQLLFTSHRNDHVISNAVQAAESSWKFLSRRAKAEGRVLFGVGSTVASLDRSVVLNERGPHAVPIDRSEATSIQGVVGELDVAGREAVTHEAYALGDRGLVAATSRSRSTNRAYQPEPREKRIVTGIVADGAGELEHAMETRDRDGRMLHEMTITVGGVRVGLMPTAVVELRNFGRRYDGYWSVDKIRFRVQPTTESSTELTLMKAPVNPRANARRRGTSVSRTGISRRAMRLVGERWVAA